MTNWEAELIITTKFENLTCWSWRETSITVVTNDNYRVIVFGLFLFRNWLPSSGFFEMQIITVALWLLISLVLVKVLQPAGRVSLLSAGWFKLIKLPWEDYTESMQSHVFFCQRFYSAERAAPFSENAFQRLHSGRTGTPRRRTSQPRWLVARARQSW